MGVPQCLKDAGVTEEQLNEMIDSMADAAFADRCTATNPKPVSKEDIIGLYRQAFVKGTRISSLNI